MAKAIALLMQAARSDAADADSDAEAEAMLAALGAMPPGSAAAAWSIDLKQPLPESASRAVLQIARPFRHAPERSVRRQVLSVSAF